MHCLQSYHRHGRDYIYVTILVEVFFVSRKSTSCGIWLPCLISAQLHTRGVYHLFSVIIWTVCIHWSWFRHCALCRLRSLHCLNCNGVTYVYRMFDILRFLLCCLIFIFVACFICGLHRFFLIDYECDTYVGRRLNYRLLCAGILSCVFCAAVCLKLCGELYCQNIVSLLRWWYRLCVGFTCVFLYKL